MTLLELLVQELPKRGGWPSEATKIHQDYDGEVFSWIDEIGPPQRIFILRQVATNARKSRQNETCENMVTREQYEAALVAEKQPVWDGEGLPPVGCECEYQDGNNRKWYPVTIKYVSDQLIVISGLTNVLGEEQNTEIAKDITCDKPQFRPIRSEADKKREHAVEALSQVVEYRHGCGYKPMSKWIYDAIAAGKIPGVKLE